MVLHETPEPGTAGVHRYDAQTLELIVCCAGKVFGKDIVATGAKSQHGTLRYIIASIKNMVIDTT